MANAAKIAQRMKNNPRHWRVEDLSLLSTSALLGATMARVTWYSSIVKAR
jgi:hypothetical protein